MSDLPDDETIRVRRTWSGEPPAPRADDFVIDEVTEVSRRRGPASAPRLSPDEPDEVVRRSTYIGSIDEVEEPTDGSTIVAHRESRRRAARRQEAPLPGSRPDAPASAQPGRVAHTPQQAGGVTYPAREVQPVIASRIPPAPTTPRQPPVGRPAAARPPRERGATILIVAGAAAAVVIAAVGALIVILLSL